MLLSATALAMLMSFDRKNNIFSEEEVAILTKHLWKLRSAQVVLCKSYGNDRVNLTEHLWKLRSAQMALCKSYSNDRVKSFAEIY